ncbi:MAG TPA: hypothetical protein VMS17_22080 [Gemmataceae bacterium]|nr:hypothetical protein [Gemmataceae bacterium]
MPEIMDCLVNYFNLDIGADGVPRRYFSYHIVAGPGPTPDSGVASIAALAVFDAEERCDSCAVFHGVQQGGPAAAIAKAIRYLDAYHEQDRLQKVQTAIRCSACL